MPGLDNRPVTLSLTGDQHHSLKNFLFPGDGAESVAILLCGQRDGDRRFRLLVREIHPIPECSYTTRTPTRVTWQTESIEPLLDRAAAEGLSVSKVHSHPCGYPDFSACDDESDEKLLPTLKGWVEADIPHGSIVMLPDGQMFGRIWGRDKCFQPIECINVVGDDLHYWYKGPNGEALPGFVASHAQAFDVGTIERLQRLSIAVIGASGTGSPTVEQLMRLGAGEIVTVDDDIMEDRNVNRILNSTSGDAEQHRPKVDVIGDAINRAGLGTRVIRLNGNLWDPDIVRAVAECDVVFGCMDSIDGRYLLNTLATFYTLPYFDIGVRLDTVRDGPEKGKIREVCGTVNYLQPGRSSLMSRGLFTMKQVAAAGLRRNDPSAHERQVKDGYIAGAENHRPAVISVNMYASSLAVNDFLARLHPYREEPNSEYAAVEFSLASMELMPDPEEGQCDILARHVGKGDVTPLLRQMELAERRIA